ISELHENNVSVIILDTEGEYTTINSETDSKDLIRALNLRGLNAQGVSDTIFTTLSGENALMRRTPINIHFPFAFPPFLLGH
ncbi:MAG: hypothetical protein AB1744_08185, partial [Candidatus Zixiibacteriota bacterium]